VEIVIVVHVGGKDEIRKQITHWMRSQPSCDGEKMMRNGNAISNEKG